MATWQTPKTNWSAEDGVMNSDFNRIEGNLQYLKDREVDTSTFLVPASKTLYVAYNGSTNGDGSSGSPFRYLNQAIAALPKNLNGNTVTFIITGSTSVSMTSGQLNITGFSNGRIAFGGAAAGPSMLCSHNISVSNGSILDVTGFTPATFAGGISASHLGLLYISCPISVSGGSIQAFNHGKIVCVDSANIAGPGIGVYASTGGHIWLSNASITNAAQNGLWATDGGIITYNTLVNNATSVKQSTTTGGRIYAGAQVSPPNY